MRLRFANIVHFGFLFMITQSFLATAQECPPGMVWGGRKCEYVEVCPDGRPVPMSGNCDQDIVKPKPVQETTKISKPVTGLECESRIVMNETDCSVLLVNGDASRLLDQYHTMIREKDKRCSFWRLRVIFFENGDKIEIYDEHGIELNWRKRMTGESALKIWKKELKGRIAEGSVDAVQLGKSKTDWDIVCGD